MPDSQPGLGTLAHHVPARIVAWAAVLLVAAFATLVGMVLTAVILGFDFEIAGLKFGRADTSDKVVTVDEVRDALLADEAAVAKLRGADGTSPEAPTPESIMRALVSDPDAMGRMTVALAEASPLPSTAVVAFDGSEGCPEGWEVYRPATARVIVGAGNDFDPKHREWFAELPTGGVRPTRLGSYPALSSGGEVEHRLSVAELPGHAHTQIWGHRRGMLGGEAVGNNVEKLYREAIQPTLKEGGDQAHNNMPPYVALFICMKE